MVSNKKQQANEKAAAAKAAKAKAAAAKAAKESEIVGGQDTSMLEGGQDESTTSLGKRKATPQDNTGHEGTRTSVTHMGIRVPSMGGSAERQTGTQLSAPVADVGSSLAASAAAGTDFATVAQAASIAPEVGSSLAANATAESKQATMEDANANSESDSSVAEEGISSEDEKLETKRRKLDEWVIPNPVNTALHPTMDLQGKRVKITSELVGQKLTEALNQHALNLNTLVPVIE
jgi:hypothetical protein